MTSGWHLYIEKAQNELLLQIPLSPKQWQMNQDLQEILLSEKAILQKG